MVDTTNNQRGGGYNYTTSSLNQPPSPCQERQKRRRVAVSPAPQRTSTLVRPIPIKKESGLLVGGGFRPTVKQEGTGTPPLLKVKDVQHLKEPRLPTVIVPPASTTLDDRHAL